MRVCWFSAGVSSFVAALLSKPDEIIYIDIDDQHPDSMRFVHDCESALGKEIKILRSQYGSVENAVRAFGFIASPYGAKCTDVLKKRVRKEWESQQTEPITHIWGMDCAERNRAEQIRNAMPNVGHEFPLIEKMLTKADAHGICAMQGVKRPAMYDLGYSNNNCIGCVKGGMGYWNKIRIDFPEVFQGRARLERDVGHSCINGVFLDELDPNAGRMSDEILPECGIFCEILIGQAHDTEKGEE
jgi:hypothetical protein